MYDLSVPIIHNGKEQNVIEKVYSVNDFPYDIMKDFNKFYKILHSNEFSRAQKLGILDSATEMDEIKESLLKGASIEQIQNALQEFATSELTVDEFQNLVEKHKGELSKDV